MAQTYSPAWLSVDDVKQWLRLQSQDSSDDDLLAKVCAMAEPYVERCRPEWRVPVVAEALVRMDADYYSTQVALRLDEWQSSHPDQPLLDARGHIVQLYNLPSDDWGVIDPGNTVQVVYLDGVIPTPSASPLKTAGGTDNVTVAEAAVWVTQRTPIVLRSVDSGTYFTATADVTSYLPDAETYQGAVMYAAREYRRRNSPAGIEMFGDVTSFVARFDPDIDRALQTGAWARPVVS